MLLSASICTESPQRKDRAVVLIFLVLSCVLVVLIIFKFFFIRILNNHSLHDLKRPFHRSTVQWILNMNLLLLNRLLVLFVFHLLFKLGPLYFFIGSHVCVEDLPLSSLKREVSLNWRISFDTFFS